MTTVATNASSKNAETAAALLRVGNGRLFTFHGQFKAFVFTFAGTAAYFQSIDLPGFLAYLTIAVEVVGGLALLAGYKTRLVSLVMIPVLLGAAYIGHGANGFVFSNPNGGWEYPAFWAVVHGCTSPAWGWCLFDRQPRTCTWGGAMCRPFIVLRLLCPPPLPPNEIASIARTVHDLPKVAVHYEKLLSLHRLSSDAAVVRLGLGRDVLVELRVDKATPRRDPREAGLFHTAFVIPSCAVLGSWLIHRAGSKN